MTYEIYRYIFWGGLILGMVMLIVAVLLFFLMNIPMVIGDLNGSNARKAIEDIKNNTSSSGRTGKIRSNNHERGKITDKIGNTGRSASLMFEGLISNTEKIGKSKSVGNETTVLEQNPPQNGNETTLLAENAAPVSNETTLLSDVPIVGSNETTVLTQAVAPVANETTVLSYQQEEPLVSVSVAEQASSFVVEFEITYIHTDEIIA